MYVIISCSCTLLAFYNEKSNNMWKVWLLLWCWSKRPFCHSPLIEVLLLRNTPSTLVVLRLFLAFPDVRVEWSLSHPPSPQQNDNDIKTFPCAMNPLYIFLPLPWIWSLLACECNSLFFSNRITTRARLQKARPKKKKMHYHQPFFIKTL